MQKPDFRARAAECAARARWMLDGAEEHQIVYAALEIRMALEAKARKLALFHHSPTRTDDQLDEMERRAHNEFPDVFAARDRQIIVV